MQTAADHELTDSGWVEIVSLRDDLERVIDVPRRLRSGVSIFGSGYQGGLLQDRLVKAILSALGLIVDHLVERPQGHRPHRWPAAALDWCRAQRRFSQQ